MGAHFKGGTMKKRVLHCAYSGLGGHAAVLFTLLSEAARNEFDHFVLFFGVEDLREEYAQACNRMGVPFAFVKKRGRVALRSHRQVMKIIREVKPDVVMVNGTPLAIPILSTRSLLRHRWAVVVRETQANHLKSLQEWVGSYLAAYSANAVVYLTNEYQAEVEDRFKFLLRRGGRVRIIPNGVDTQEYEGDALCGTDAVRLAMVSRLVSIKDHLTLIEAVRILVHDRKYADLKLFIAGEGPTLTSLRAHAAAAGLEEEVIFTGLLSNSGVTELLRSVHIYVHCTFGETMSNSILQAMAAGLPVVASDVEGVSNLVRHGKEGVLVPVENAVVLANALEALIQSPQTRQALGSEARKRIVRDFSRGRMVESYNALFAAVAGDPETPAETYESVKAH